MRKLVVTTFVSLDGVMQAPGGPDEDRSGGFAHGGWLVPHFDEDLGAQMDEWFKPAEDFLLGRTTYEIFYASSPNAPQEDEVSTALNTKTKRVASRTLPSVGWETARLIEGDVGDAVRRLKEQDGGGVQAHGSAGLIQTLLKEGLVDELRLVAFPVTLGEGNGLSGGHTVPGAWRWSAPKASATGAVTAASERVGDIEPGEGDLG